MKSAARTSWTLWALLSVLLPAAFAAGQQRDEYGEVRQTVARISYLSGEVSFARGDDPDDWQAADRNVPMTLGDRLYTGSRSRVEVQIHGGNTIRLGARSDLAALNLTDDTKQFSIRAGIASFQIRRLFEDELFEVDMPNAAVTFDRPGFYRVDVDERGNTRVSVRQGRATVAAGGGQVPVEEGETIDLEGLDSPRYDIVSLSRPDSWDQWVEEREGRLEHSHSLQYMSPDIVGAEDLDEHGRWEDVPQYGRVWTPTAVAVDWAPYRVGHWIWQDPWGWTWVSSEPWGWAPYHYGRWVVVSSHWYWVPVAHRVHFVSYSPALVAFVGGGPGWSASVTVGGGGGFVGWFPLGPRDPFQPWWGARAYTRPSTVTNVTYVNKTYVTIVNHNTFVSGGVVTNSVVRDRAVVTQVSAAPVLRGPIPIVPTAASLRLAVQRDAVAVARPPAAISTRQVVARMAPPPAPPTFQAKLAVINQNQGAPVAPAAAARISVENRGRAQSVTTVRPAAEAGRVELAPRAGSTDSRERKAEPVTAFRGRPMATTQQPVATNPVAGSTAPSANGAAPREIAPRVERQVVQPTPAPGRAVGQPGESGRPQIEDSRGRVRPTDVPPQGQPQTIERRRVEAPPATPAPETSIERRRVQPTPPVQQAPETLERRRVEPTSPPQKPPENIERRRVQPTAPPPQPPASLERRQERPTVAPPQSQRPTAPPAEHPPAEVQRGRERPTPPPAQNVAPPSEKPKEVGRPSSAPPTAPPRAQGGEKEQPKPQRGRPTPKPEPTKKPE